MPDDSESPGELVERASHGDEHAIESLIERLLPGLDRFLRRRAGALILTRESGTDLVQSVCREALERLADERLEYRGEAEFKQWLYHAAELKLKNRHRFYGRDRRDPGREAPIDRETLVEHLYRSMHTPSQEVVRREEVERLDQAFEGLDERARRIIVFFHVDGLSHREIAERMQIEESHSRTLLTRAMARLARLAT